MDEGPYKVIDIPGLTSAEQATITLNTEAKAGWDVLAVAPLGVNGQLRGLRVILQKRDEPEWQPIRPTPFSRVP